MAASDDSRDLALYVNERWEEICARRTALYRFHSIAAIGQQAS
ncbi:hypothetical protein ACWGQ5_47175 [Streptomyces sp. NPDC055722]